MYHTGHALKVSTAMKETMEAERWAPGLWVCCQPPDAMPSDTRQHRLLMVLLWEQVQVNAPLHAWLWADHQHMSLEHLPDTGVEAYWQCARTSPAPLVTVTTSVPPWLWIAVALTAVANFKYSAVCVAHRCPGHLYKWPLYYPLHTLGTLPAEFHPALKTHLWEHLPGSPPQSAW